MIYTINNCIRAFGYTNFDKLIADMGSVDNLREYVRANGYADIAVAEDTELLLVDVNGKTWHTGCYGAQLGPEPEYLCFTSTGDSTVAMAQEGTPNKSANKVIQYRLNNGQWQNWNLSAVSLADGDKMYIKSDDTIPISEAGYIYKYFIISGSIAASGNIMSLINFSDTLTDYAFCDLFKDCTSLTTAPTLPTTILSAYCYASMFKGCTSLANSPELQATTLAQGCYNSMFEACTSLVQAAELPAISLGEGCYANMFKGCTSLVQAPELPATTLDNECYAAMFSGCTSLVQAPELPAVELKYRCYKQMFNGCTSLTHAPALPATILAEECYNEMFNRCTSLTQAPVLPATILGSYCCSYMFNGCTALVQAPALQATELAQGCYAEMFMNCTSLVQAPELPAATLAQYCYVEMFSGCSNLNYVKAMFTDISAEGCLNSWLSNVSPTGTFIKSKDATWTNEQAGIPTGWTVQVEGGVTPEPEPERDYLCFTSTGDSTVAMHQEGTPNASANKVIQYKLNNGQWQNWDLSAVSLSDGDKMYLKSDDDIPISESDNIYKQFTMTGSIAASGNIMSLLNFSTTLTSYAFYCLFNNCTSLTTAPALPATTLAPNCYAYMFSFCEMLNYVKAMFTDVSTPNSLTHWLTDVSPTGTFIKSKDATWTNEDAKIPTGWTVQVEGGVTPEPEPEKDYLCFTSTGDSTISMKQKGTPNTSANKVIQYKLNDGQWQTWDLSAVTLADGDKMYLKSDDEIPISESNQIYKNFVMSGSIAANGNIMSLLNFSTTLTDYAFYSMFNNCASLTSAPELHATTLAKSCYYYMFSGCSSLTTAPALPATTLPEQCYREMFNFCTSLTSAPELPATTLTNYCYQEMFYYCQNLNYVKALFTDISAQNCLISWLYGVPETGTFVKNAAATWTNEQANIPTGWTVQTASPDK